MAEFKMFAAGIDNGSHFNMRITTMTGPAWKNMFEVEQEPGKSIGSVWNIRTPSFAYNGYEAPTIDITGVIDLSQTPTAKDGGVGSLYLTLARLGSFSLCGSGYVLYPFIGEFLAQAGFSNAFTGSIPCIINTVTPTINMNYSNGSEYISTYNMRITLVSGPV